MSLLMHVPREYSAKNQIIMKDLPNNNIVADALSLATPMFGQQVVGEIPYHSTTGLGCLRFPLKFPPFLKAKGYDEAMMAMMCSASSMSKIQILPTERQDCLHTAAH